MCGERLYQVYAYRVAFIGTSLSTGKMALVVLIFFLWAAVYDGWPWNAAALLQTGNVTVRHFKRAINIWL